MRQVRAREDAQEYVAERVQEGREPRGQVVPALVEGEEGAPRVAWYGMSVELVVVDMVAAGVGIPVAVIDLVAAGVALMLDIPAVFAGPRLVVGMVEYVDRVHNVCSRLLALY